MNLPPSASEEQKLYHEQTHCQSCGRFVGVFDRCPYCQAVTTKRLSLRVFKLLSVLVSTVGLALLLFYARTIQPPLITIDSLTPLTNFAQVRIRGTVERSFGIHPQWGSLSFVLAQKGKTGEVNRIRVSAYGKVASEVAALNNVPQEGDELTVQGLVRFQKDNPGILLNSGRRIEFHKRASAAGAASAAPLSSSEVKPEMVGKTVQVKGKVAEVLTFPRGILIRLDQRREGLPVWVPSRVHEDMEIDLSTLDEDDEIIVSGKVKPYKQDVEIEVAAANAIRRLGESKPGTKATPAAPGAKETATVAPASATVEPLAKPPAETPKTEPKPVVAPAPAAEPTPSPAPSTAPVDTSVPPAVSPVTVPAPAASNADPKPDALPTNLTPAPGVAPVTPIAPAMAPAADAPAPASASTTGGTP